MTPDQVRELDQKRAVCGLCWTDGWADHHCVGPANHDGPCRCHCDAEYRESWR